MFSSKSSPTHASKFPARVVNHESTAIAASDLPAYPIECWPATIECPVRPVKIIIRGRFRSIIGSNETSRGEQRRQIKSPQRALSSVPRRGRTPTDEATLYTFTFERRRDARVCVVLAHFYCRKPNWSARDYRAPCSRSPTFFLVPVSAVRSSLFRESTHRPAWLEPLLHRYVPAPYRVLNTNRDVSFREFPKTFRTRSLPLMKKSTLRSPLLSKPPPPPRLLLFYPVPPSAGFSPFPPIPSPMGSSGCQFPIPADPRPPSARRNLFSGPRNRRRAAVREEAPRPDRNARLFPPAPAAPAHPRFTIFMPDLPAGRYKSRRRLPVRVSLNFPRERSRRRRAIA